MPPCTGVTELPSTNTKVKVRRILLMIFVFILFIRCVCFVRMLSCSIHLYRTGRLIFPENALPCHVPGGFCYRHKTSPVCFGKLASREKVKGNDRVTIAPLLQRLWQSIKLPSTYQSLNSPAYLCVAIILPDSS